MYLLSALLHHLYYIIIYTSDKFALFDIVIYFFFQFYSIIISCFYTCINYCTRTFFLTKNNSNISFCLGIVSFKANKRINDDIIYYYTDVVQYIIIMTTIVNNVCSE